MRTHSPNKPKKKFKQTLFACYEADDTLFWDRKGVQMAEFKHQ
jgi:hypothetical protein